MIFVKELSNFVTKKTGKIFLRLKTLLNFVIEFGNIIIIFKKYLELCNKLCPIDWKPLKNGGICIATLIDHHLPTVVKGRLCGMMPNEY